jgi:hydrogenase maturation protease
MKTLVVGLGNVILGDEGVGIYIAEEIAKRIGTHESVKVVRTSWGGLNLLDFFDGIDRVIIIDAVKNYRGIPGEIHKLIVEELTNVKLSSFTNGVDLKTAVDIGKNAGRHIPKKIEIYAIEVKEDITYEASLSPHIAEKVSGYAEKIIATIVT